MVAGEVENSCQLVVTFFFCFVFGLTLPNYRNKSGSAQRSPPLISTTSSAADFNVCILKWNTHITYHLRILGFLKCNISRASLQTKQVKFVCLFSSDSQSSWSMKLQWDHIICTLELTFQGRLPMYRHCCSIFKWRTNEYSSARLFMYTNFS